MQRVASLEKEQAQQLLEHLRKSNFSAELQSANPESGLEIMEILVPDDDFERACEAAEEWDRQRNEKIQKKSGHHCPKCGSYHLEVLPNKQVLAYRCRDCGAEIIY